MNERQHQILELLMKDGFVSVDYLSKKLYSSGATIRRDLSELEKDKKLKRVHGGAIGLNGISSDSPYSFRTVSSIEEKKHIALLAKKFVHDSSTLFLDSSSTVSYLANEIMDFNNLSIITNSTEIVYKLANNFDGQIFATGGRIRNNVTMHGAVAQNMVKERYADIFFFSCSGLSSIHGTTESNEDSAELKRIMFQNSFKHVLLCDSSKFEKIYSYKCFSLDQLDALITNKKPSDSFMQNIPETLQVLF